MKREFIIKILCFGFLFFAGFAFETKADTVTVTDNRDITIGNEGCFDGCTL